MNTTTMKALRSHRRGGSETLVYEDAPLPTLQAGDVLVEVHAAAITFDEFHWPETWVDEDGRDRTPIIPSHEVSGIVAALAEDVDSFKVGDRVFGRLSFTRDGAAAEYVAVSQTDLALAPTIPHAETAAAPLAALTAWQALVEHARLRAGEKVLVLGAAGGVGSYTVQLAKALGATVAGSTRSASNTFAATLGADELVVVGSPDFERATAEADVVIDTIGGPILHDVAALMHDGARLITLGEPIPAGLTEGRNIEATFFIVDSNREQLDRIANLLSRGELRPVIAATYPLEQGRRAYEESPALRRPGKTVLVVRD
ncbi:NADP-dependent oxidoreductase [Arthrobacter sp. TMN-37]